VPVLAGSWKVSPDGLDLAPGVERHRPRLLTIMGSGETAPPMAKVHRLLVERLGPPPVKVVLLDTPYGFQENTDQISQRAAGYFERNLGVTPGVARWRSVTDDVLRREQALAQIRDAAYVFAGPGSPPTRCRSGRTLHCGTCSPGSWLTAVA
jgi:hypothetical protein